MIHVDVRADIHKVQIYLRACRDGGARATSRALNRTATTVRAEAARLIQGKRALNIGTIKKALRVERSTSKSLLAKVIASGRPISIRHFSRLSFDTIKGKRTGVRGVSLRILKKDRARIARKYGNKAFTSPKIGGGLPIMVRTGPKRLPIEAWTPVPGFPTVFVQETIAAAMRRVAVQSFRSRLKAELNYELNVAKRKAV